MIDTDKLIIYNDLLLGVCAFSRFCINARFLIFLKDDSAPLIKRKGSKECSEPISPKNVTARKNTVSVNVCLHATDARCLPDAEARAEKR